MTYSNLGNLAGGNLGWEERPATTQVVEHRSSRGDERKPQTPSDQQQSYHQQSLIQRNSRPEITDLVEAMNNLRARKSYELFLILRFAVSCCDVGNEGCTTAPYYQEINESP
jgi:hypothetical protein